MALARGAHVQGRLTLDVLDESGQLLGRANFPFSPATTKIRRLLLLKCTDDPPPPAPTGKEPCIGNLPPPAPPLPLTLDSPTDALGPLGGPQGRSSSRC
jgi:hypothetical protein